MDQAAEIAALRATVAALDARLALVERRRGPRDDHEHAALAALALVVADATFTAADVLKLGDLDPAFRRHLDQADVWNAPDVGYLLRQARGHHFAGRRLDRADARHAWRFVLDASGIGQP